MAWITPFDAWMSVLLTMAPLTVTTLSLSPSVNSLPETVFTLSPSCILPTAAAERFPGSTWKSRMPFSFSLSFSRDSISAFGSFANAASVGANTVYGPAPLSVLTRSASRRAEASVLKFPAAAAVSMMSLLICVSRGSLPVERSRIKGAKQVNLRGVGTLKRRQRSPKARDRCTGRVQSVGAGSPRRSLIRCVACSVRVELPQARREAADIALQLRRSRTGEDLANLQIDVDQRLRGSKLRLAVAKADAGISQQPLEQDELPLQIRFLRLDGYQAIPRSGVGNSNRFHAALPPDRRRFTERERPCRDDATAGATVCGTSESPLECSSSGQGWSEGPGYRTRRLKMGSSGVADSGGSS